MNCFRFQPLESTPKVFSSSRPFSIIQTTSLSVEADAAMAIPASLVIVPVGTLFFLSGLIVNLIQSCCVRNALHDSRSPAAAYILFRPFAKNLYRRINKVVVELLWLELIWLVDWWAGVKVELYADPETIKMMGEEHAMVICNHRSDIDWLVGWVLAQRSDCLGSALAIMKKSVKFLPVIGWSMWFSDYIFLDRSWAKDEITLKSGFKRLADFPRPFWLALFVEGTRFTEAKLLAAQEYAVSRGLPVPRNVLIPRTKGFVTAVTHMRAYVPAIYDCTLDISKDKPSPSMLRILRGQSSVVKLQMRRHSIKDLPETAEGIGQWCKDIFVTKDAFLENYKATGIFGNLEPLDIGRHKKSLILVITWSFLLSFGIVKLFIWSSWLLTWQGIVSLCVVCVIMVIMMHVLIHFSKAEGSTRSRDPAQENLLGR